MINANLFFNEKELDIRVKHFNETIAKHIRNL